MISGLLMELEDHNCWTIAEAAGHRGPHRLQHFLSRAVWDEQQVLDIASAWAVSSMTAMRCSVFKVARGRTNGLGRNRHIVI